MKPIKHKLPSTHEEWLENRLKGIGGSDAGAVLGFNQYKSPYLLWLEKTGRFIDDKDNEAMRIGRDLEDYVAQRFTEATGKKARKSNFSFQSAEHPFMLANIDRWIVGENAGLECKTTSAFTKTKYDKGDIPAAYYAQCMHYMAVTGADKWYIAIIVLGKGFYWYTVERDEEEIKALVEAEQEFWRHVEEDSEPPIDGYDCTSEAIENMHPTDNGESFVLFGRDEEIKKYIELKNKKKEIDSEIKTYENILKNDLGDFETAFTDDYTVSWKTCHSDRVDTKALKETYPNVYNEVIKTSTTRRFAIKEGN